MTYNEIAKQIEQLTYRDKLRLAQLLLQLAGREEEQNPEKRVAAHSHAHWTRSLFNTLRNG